MEPSFLLCICIEAYETEGKAKARGQSLLSWPQTVRIKGHLALGNRAAWIIIVPAVCSHLHSLYLRPDGVRVRVGRTEWALSRYKVHRSQCWSVGGGEQLSSMGPGFGDFGYLCLGY